MADIPIQGKFNATTVAQILADAYQIEVDDDRFLSEAARLTDVLYELSQGAANGLPKTGGTMQGNINMNSNKVTNLPTPTSNGDAANKKYVDDSIPSVPSASTTNPSMDGTASYGSGTTWARADHVHPTDTTRAPLASPALTGTPTAPTPTTGDNSTKLATTAFVAAAIAAVGNTMVFKGTVNSASDLPATHTAGWTYVVGTAGSYVGQTCEVGDTIYCVASGTAASNADWVVVQTNINGAVTGPASSTSGHIPTFNGTSGKVLQDGYGVASSISDDSTTIPTTAAVNSGLSRKLGTSGDGSNVTVAFSAASSRTAPATGEKLSVLFGKVLKWFNDLGTAAFKNISTSVTSGDDAPVSGGAVYTALADKSKVQTASGTIGTSATSATVNYSGTLVNAYATMGGSEVLLDVAVSSSSVTFTCSAAPASAITCVVVYV